ncbi:MAG TPA: hypothetical protein PKU78_06855, partial [Candidatus Dojkabacteria bacterium]|nr:hypothetical protein [Candidatus Dojkabacteria bacterium]
EWIDVNVDEQSQVCSFKSDNIQFNIKLQDDRSTMVSKIRVPVFKSFSFEHKIEITDALGMKLRKAQTFCKDAGRWTLAQEDSKIYFVFGDTKDTSNSSDTMKILISDSYDEAIPQKTYDDELIKLALSKDDFDININHNGAMFISIDHDNAKLNYITTPLKD